MGGEVVYLKNYVHQLVPHYNFVIFIQISRILFGTEKDIVLAFVYIPPHGSPFYKSEELSGIDLLEHWFIPTDKFERVLFYSLWWL